MLLTTHPPSSAAVMEDSSCTQPLGHTRPVIRSLFYHFPKYYMKSMLGDFNIKLGREYLFNSITGNGTLPKNINDNGVGYKLCPSKNTFFFRLITYLQIGDIIHVYSMYDLLEEMNDTG